MEQYHIFKLGLAVLFYAAYCFRPMLVNGLQPDYLQDQNNQTNQVRNPEDFLVFYQGVEGVPGEDFPIYSHIPKTTFSCTGIESGYYADLDTDCQVFHICEDEKKISFLCPNGTIFQQSDLICEWWFKVNCTDSPNLYAESAEHLREDVARRKHLRKLDQNGDDRLHGAVMRIEEASSVSVRRNGKNIAVNEKAVSSQKPKEDKKDRKRFNINNQNLIETQSQFSQVVHKQKSPNNVNQQSLNLPKNRRYNDDQTGNYLNNDYQDNTKYSSQKPAVAKHVPTTQRSISVASNAHTLKEYHVQFSATSPGLDRSSNENYNTNSQTLPTTTVPQDQPKTNRGNVKFNTQFSEYELQFPKHQSEFKTSTIKPTTQKPVTENRNNYNQISDADSSKLLNRNLESDEAQITQESSSFVKNSFNSIQDKSQKYSTFNPYPNHRTTYSDLKTPSFTPSKLSTTISSVTPQYITTQPINNGKPFLGSRVGANIHTSIGPVPVLANYSSTTQSHIYFSDSNTEKPNEASRSTSSAFTTKFASSSADEESKKSTKVLLTNTKTPSTDSDRSIEILNTVSSSSPIVNQPPESSFTRFTIPSTTLVPLIRAGSSPQPFLTSSAIPIQNAVSNTFISFVPETTTRRIDHATIYGTFKGSSTTPAPRSFSQGVPFKFDKNSNKVSIHLSKSLGGNTSPATTTREEFVRFNQNRTPIKIDSSQIKNNKNKDRVNVQLTKSFSGGPFINYINTTPLPNENPKYGNSIHPPLLHLDAFVRTSDIIKNLPVTKSTGIASSGKPYSADISNTYQTVTNGNQRPGFFITKNSVYESSTPSTEGTTQRPRPFEKLTADAASTAVNLPVTPTYVNYKISSASPFKLRDGSKSITPAPTSPTVLTTTPSIYQNLDNMINVLKKLVSQQETDYSSETPRPGLVIPPSVGPQTLHTLAVYFANALDGISTDKEKIKEIEEEGITKEKLANLLTQMTVHGYDQLFKDKSHEFEKESTTVATDDDEGENGLQLQGSKNIVQTPHIRELARNFSLALSSYLHDPDMFKKDLEDLRPTEPPSLEEETVKDSDNAAEEELLNFSDADAKSSFPPIFSTGLPSPSPTWGFILATKSENDLDVKNSLNPDLNTADSQSFVPRFNNVNADDKKKIPREQLPGDHWTTSPSATKLWKTTFSVHPAFVNDHFETTPLPPSSETESIEIESLEHENLPSLPVIVRPHHEINYELRTLPKLKLNSTQIHGILIDFMNTSTPDSDRLHRILKKLNTSEEEFLDKMKEIETNPLTKRLILLLISECGENAAKEIENLESKESLEVAGTGVSNYSGHKQKSNSYLPELLDSSLSEEDQDTRALQLLNSLYSIASKFGKR